MKPIIFSYFARIILKFANRFTVQKDTPNKGRQFFSCAKLQSDATRCSFFLWADFTDNNATANRNEPRNPRPGFTNFNNRAGPSFKARKRGMLNTILEPVFRLEPRFSCLPVAKTMTILPISQRRLVTVLPCLGKMQYLKKLFLEAKWWIFLAQISWKVPSIVRFRK